MGDDAMVLVDAVVGAALDAAVVVVVVAGQVQ